MNMSASNSSKITRLHLWELALTSHTPYYMSDGKTCDTVTSIILQIDTDRGISGFGEVCAIPAYLPAFAGGVQAALTDSADALLGQDAIGGGCAMAAFESALKGHLYVKSAINMALWDITAKAAKLPLYALLGGRQNDTLPLYHSITCVAPDEMARIAKEAHAQGIRQFQVKLGADNDWQADVARLCLVREAIDDGSLVYGDWNCGATRLTATRVGRAVATRDIMLEQPCSTLEDCAAVRQATGLAMKIDENAYDTATLLRAHQLGCMDAVAIKTSKFGGVEAVRRARDLCLYLGCQMCIEDTWGSDIATAAALHLAAATPPSAILNVCDLSGYVAPRLDDTAPVRQNGRIAPPEGIGLGIIPQTDLLGAAVIFD